MSYFKTRLRPEERMGVMHMDMLGRSFNVALEDIRGKLEGYEGLEQDVETMRGICLRMVEYALKDQPPETASLILRQSRDFTIGLQRRSPVRKELEVIMPISDEWQFVQAVVESRCSICLLSATDAAKCPVRALLRRYSDEPEPGFAACGFIGCKVGQNDSANAQEAI